MKVVLLRHPAPDIAPGICYGRLDVALEPAAQRGLSQRATDPRLRGAIRIWTSPARRCLELASVVARALSAELVVDERLQELDFGEWEGQHWNDVRRALLDEWAASPEAFAPPGGEAGIALIQRVSAFVFDLRDYRRDCVVVSHGGPLKILIALLAGQPIDLLAAPPPVGSVTVMHIG